MTAILEKLTLYWAYPFVRYALVVGVLIALCSSLLGVTLVLKRFSFIGDGLSHVAFGAMAIAAVLQITNEMPLVMVITIISAVLLLRTGQNTKIKGDAAIAMISVGALAIGYLLMNLFSTSTNLSGDVCSTLFGSTSILTLTKSEVWLCAVLSVAVVAVFVLCYNKIFAVTFDENFAKAVGTKADLYNLLIAITIAVVIVLAMNLVGSLLISALVIFPALSAMRVYKNFRAVTICAAVLSVCCATLGILISILAGTPVGSTIVAVDIFAFLIFSGISRLGGIRTLNRLCLFSPSRFIWFPSAPAAIRRSSPNRNRAVRPSRSFRSRWRMPQAKRPLRRLQFRSSSLLRMKLHRKHPFRNQSRCSPPKRFRTMNRHRPPANWMSI